MFCDKCGSMVFPREGGWVCNKCGKEGRIGKKGRSVITEKMSEEKEMLIVDEKMETLPKTRVECPKCKNMEAFWVLRQTRAADEPETRIYRCTGCGNTWREY